MDGTKAKPEVIDRGRYGWAIRWNDDQQFLSAMPDEKTAKECASAPALLAALKALSAYVDGYEYGRKWAGRPHEEMDLAREAIAKATT